MIEYAKMLLFRAMREGRKMKGQSIAISMVYPIMKIIVRKGFDAEAFCRYASFDSALLHNVEARIPGQEFTRLMAAAAEFTGDEYFGLHQGQMMEPADLGILGYVMMHSRTVADTLAAYQRYNVILCNAFNLSWEIQGNDLVIRLFIQQGGMSRHCVEEMASSLYCLIGRYSNRPIPLSGLAFAHGGPADTHPYVEVFGVEPEFESEENELRMRKEVLDYPVLYSDARLLEVFETIAEETKNKIAQTGPFTEKVVHWIKNCLPERLPTLQQTAEAFGVSVRTIQNRLRAENTSYHEVMAGVRKELAEAYLRKKEFSIGDIAYALHFSEPSAFQIAFKKWTGVTPGQYRANYRQGYGMWK
jgi:AraC-like DNA-binding protein